MNTEGRNSLSIADKFVNLLGGRYGLKYRCEAPISFFHYLYAPQLFASNKKSQKKFFLTDKFMKLFLLLKMIS